MVAKVQNLVRMFSAPDEDGTVKSVWFNATKEVAGTVTTAGFFNACRHKLAVGDLILSAGSVDLLLLRVDTVPASGNVTVSAETGAAAA